MQNSDLSLVPVTIVGGFLGSGKTSLLNHILTSASNKRVAVLVNDFGEINVDAKLIVSIEGETISLANGCICCSIRDDLLVEVLKLFAKKPLPEHIVIETSGVSKPVSVAETFLNPAIQGLVDVQNIIAVVDADMILDEDAGYGDMAFDQIKVADLVVINKTDLVSPQRLAEVKQRVEDIVPRARIWETTFGEVPLDLIFDDQISQAMLGLRENDSSLTPHHAHHHDAEFATWTFRSKAKWSFNALAQAVEHLPRDIFRAKGMVQLDLDTDDYGILQMTGRRGWLRLVEPESLESKPAATELVFIGKPGATTNEHLKTHFDQALATANSDGYIVSDLRAFNVIFA